MKDEIEITMNQKIYQIDAFATRLLAKLGNDGFSLALFGTKVADSEEFCKKSNTAGPIIADDHYYISSFDRFGSCHYSSSDIFKQSPREHDKRLIILL